MSLRPGLLIEKKYELVERLGFGGMGEVWRARRGAHFFGIKFILPALVQDDSIVDRFKSEIFTAMKLRTPHAVRAHDFGVDPRHGPYLVMELLAGETLRSVLARGRIENVGEAIDYVLQAAEAVAEAHQLGIVHRDLKPENLFLTNTNGGPFVKVLDFGIARIRDDIRDLTQAGSFLGTRNYASPEQFENSVDVTERSDIWSLGAILYELLSGSRAFPGEELKPVAQILSASTVALASLRPGLSPALVAAVERCLQRKPELRFPDAAMLRAALLPFSSSATERALGDASTERIAPPPTARTGGAVRGMVRVGALNRPNFGELGALVEATCVAEKSDATPRRVIFMLGAGFSVGAVPKTEEFIELIRAELPKADRATLKSLQHGSANLYQDAFRLLRSRKSSYVANQVVRRAILNAYQRDVELVASENAQARQCAELEDQLDHWTLPEGVEHLGDIVHAGLWRAGPKLSPGIIDSRFSGIHLTTNFDPLLAISVRRRGGAVLTYSSGKDGRLPRPNKQTCAIVHLHGRWDEGDTLHVDLDVPRPQLEDSLHELLNGSTLVVLGYGGWDDVFVRTLTQVAARDHDFDIRWGFYEIDQSKIEAEHEALIQKLTNALAPRITFYRGIDTSSFFRELKARVLEPTVVPASRRPPDIERDRTPLPPVPPTPTPRPERHVPRPLVGMAAALVGVTLVAGTIIRSVSSPELGVRSAAMFSALPVRLATALRPPRFELPPVALEGRRSAQPGSFEGQGGPTAKGESHTDLNTTEHLAFGSERRKSIVCRYHPRAKDEPDVLTVARGLLCQAAKRRSPGPTKVGNGEVECQCVEVP